MNIGIDAGALRDRLAGVGWYLWQLLEEFPGIAPEDVFHLYASRPLKAQPSAAGFRLHSSASGRLLPGTYWLQAHARSFVRRDSLDCFWGPAHFLPSSLPDNLRTVLTVHDLVAIYYPGHMSRYNAFVHRLHFRRSVERADAIIADSHSTRNDLLRELGVPEHKVRVVHAGVSGLFRPVPVPETTDRLHALGVPDRFVLSVGTIEPRKNYPLLFQALAGIPDLHLVIAGHRGWKYRRIIGQIAELGLEKRVQLLDYVRTPDLVALYNRAELVVLPSLYEGFGLPVLEAMACGTPVLASNTSSLPEVGGDAAAYFESNSSSPCVPSLCGSLLSRKPGPQWHRKASSAHKNSPGIKPPWMLSRFSEQVKSQVGSRRESAQPGTIST